MGLWASFVAFASNIVNEFKKFFTCVKILYLFKKFAYSKFTTDYSLKEVYPLELSDRQKLFFFVFDKFDTFGCKLIYFH